MSPANRHITGSCHCGAVTVSHTAAETLVQCNCQICRRLGAVWAHGDVPLITITETGPTIRYVRADGDGDLVFVSCATCGVSTHWASADPASTRRAINATLCDPASLRDIPLRHFDGADSWTFLD